MRTWLLTNTSYSTWLPGDPRGCVTSVRDLRPDDQPRIVRFEHDLPGEPWEDPLPGLYRSAAENMCGPPIHLNLAQAEALLGQFRETSGYRGRTLLAVAVMRNHFHMVVQVPGDPCPKRMLADFKAYGTRALNGRFGRPLSERWWTENGSNRKVRDVPAAVHYVLYKQPYSLVVWSPELGRLV
jgi:REP element-mobilizing transposase RayT